MPTPDTFLMAQAQALRTKPPELSQREAKMREIWGDLDQGVADSLQGLQDLAIHPLDSLREMGSSLKQLALHPVQSAKALKQSLSNPREATRFVGSMLTPDPLSVVKALRGTKALAPPTSNIVVPETLALPEEALALELARRGAPDHETGWFKGEDNLFRKELEPIQFDVEDMPKVGEFFPPDFWKHPDLARRLEKHGVMGDEWNPMVRMYDVPDLWSGEKAAALYHHGGQIDLGPGYRHGEKFRNQLKEVLTHEFQHAIQEQGALGPRFRGSDTHGKSFRRYLQNRGEIEARAAAARDYLLDPRYREVVPFDWNTKKMLERLRHGKNTPKMEGPQEFLEDMEQWLTLTEPTRR